VRGDPVRDVSTRSAERPPQPPRAKGGGARGCPLPQFSRLRPQAFPNAARGEWKIEKVGAIGAGRRDWGFSAVFPIARGGRSGGAIEKRSARLDGSRGTRNAEWRRIEDRRWRIDGNGGVEEQGSDEWAAVSM
jgi:hypothetical protein